MRRNTLQDTKKSASVRKLLCRQLQHEPCLIIHRHQILNEPQSHSTIPFLHTWTATREELVPTAMVSLRHRPCLVRSHECLLTCPHDRTMQQDDNIHTNRSSGLTSARNAPSAAVTLTSRLADVIVHQIGKHFAEYSLYTTIEDIRVTQSMTCR